MNYEWEFVLLRNIPGLDGRVPTSAFIGSYRATLHPSNVPGYLAGLPGLDEAVWIGIVRLERS